MNENGNFMDWLKYRWKRIMVSDIKFFRFVWITAICITLITVLISAGVVASRNKDKDKKAKKQEATTEMELLATYTDATPQDATVTDANAWELFYVSVSSPLTADFQVGELTELKNNNKIDTRAYPDLQKMFDDARAAGYFPGITASYRTAEDMALYKDKKINEYLDQGMTQDEAKAKAEQSVVPGTSEHETGFAIDIGSESGDTPDEAMWSWFQQNAYKYGFIIRYPESKVAITGISDEPYHLRYVGVEAATYMYDHGQCLEEYLGIN